MEQKVIEVLLGALVLRQVSKAKLERVIRTDFKFHNELDPAYKRTNNNHKTILADFRLF